MTFKATLISLLLVVAAAPALARDPTFVSPQQILSFNILPSPPDEDSATTRAELAELHRIEAARTDAEAAAAQFDEANENIFVFKSVFGDGFTAEKLPTVAAFGIRARSDEGMDTRPAKLGFHRRRPYNLDTTLHPICKTKVVDDSYPSGHTTTGYLLALVLIDMVPEKRDALLARADDYAHNRLVCGVHFPSDLAAARLIAYAMHAAMAQNADYKKELAAARAELRTSLGLAALE